MTSFDRFPFQSKNSGSESPNVESIDNLLDVLVDSDSSPNTPASELSNDFALEELEAKTDGQDSDRNFNFIENSSFSSEIAQYSEILAIETESASNEKLVDSVNTLIPLIVELLKYKINDSQETVLQAITPIVERLIEQRSLEEPQKMAAAIAKILPAAITEQINFSPTEIANAIAPELALSIKEQIRLDENAIAEALGSEMGRAIKTQIEVEKDAMVDALYPVIGDTIAKYMVEVVKEINSKVENTLSPEGLKRKLRARIKGVSEAELILQESVGCHVQAVFLISKNSGLIIQKVQRLGEQALDADLLAGMLTAIRSFANDCLVSGSELDSIDYGNWQIHLEVAGYCYLAVILKGEPTKKFISYVRSVFGELVLNHSQAIAKFEGNPETVPADIKQKLEQLIEPKIDREPKASAYKALIWFLAFILAISLIPWGIVASRSRTAHNIEQITAIQLDAAPELSVYRLESKVKHRQLTIQGRVPSEYLRSQATTIGQKIASLYNLQLNNQIVTVDVPINPSLLMGEIARLTELFNQQPGILIKTKYQPNNLLIEGFILDENQEKSIIKAFGRIPGVKQTIINIAHQLPALKERIYFDSSSTKIDFAYNSSKIKSVIKFLNQYPNLHLKLMAYTDGIGSKQINQKLAIQRCSNLQTVFVARGIESSRLINNCEAYRVFTRQNPQAIRLTRYVEFEPFIPPQQSP
jgi:outer membrane protein OmpA-like peptidoglycan-associated protein